MGKVDGPAGDQAQLDAGIQVIKLDDAQSKILLEGGLRRRLGADHQGQPEQGPKLREMMPSSRSRPMASGLPGAG